MSQPKVWKRNADVFYVWTQDGYMKVQLKEKGIFSSVLHIASNFVADEVFLSIEKN